VSLPEAPNPERSGAGRKKAVSTRHRSGNGHGRERLVVAAADLADREGWLGLNLSRVASTIR
jgi:hypothetical protein